MSTPRDAGQRGSLARPSTPPRGGSVRAIRIVGDLTTVRVARDRGVPVLVVKLEAEAADLEATVAGLLADAETTDAAEDARYGVAGKDADLPAELDRREKRLARLQAARAQIEAEAAAKARARAEETERRRQAARTGPASPMSPKSRRRARPKPKAQANFTDPDHAS